MSERGGPGGRTYVPVNRVVVCGHCGAQVALATGAEQDAVLRKHLNPNRPKHLSRPERICPSSRTDGWVRP